MESDLIAANLLYTYILVSICLHSMQLMMWHTWHDMHCVSVSRKDTSLCLTMLLLSLLSNLKFPADLVCVWNHWPGVQLCNEWHAIRSSPLPTLPQVCSQALHIWLNVRPAWMHPGSCKESVCPSDPCSGSFENAKCHRHHPEFTAAGSASKSRRALTRCIRPLSMLNLQSRAVRAAIAVSH